MKKLLILAVAASLSAGVALASEVECATGTDTSFGDGATFVLSGSCTVGGVTFSNFEIYGATGFTGESNSFGMTVYVDTTTGGLDFEDNGLTSLQDIHLTFQGSPGITEETLIAGVGSTISEGICGSSFNIVNGTSACGSDLLNTSILTATNGGSSSSQVTYAPTDYFYKDIGGGSEFSEIAAPEPMTLSLMGFGLLGLGIAGRRLRRK